MARPGTIHNAVGALAALYTEVVGELLEQNERLNAMVQRLGAQLKPRQPTERENELAQEALECLDRFLSDTPTDGCEIVGNAIRFKLGDGKVVQLLVTVEEAK